MNSLQKIDSPGLPDVRRADPSIGGMLQAVIERGVTAENAAAFEKLVAVYERMQDRDAEKQFAAAMAELQDEMQNVKPVRAVPNNDGSVRYRFTPYEEIMKEVGPRLKAHGFTVAFSTDYVEGRLIKICTLQHTGGHSKSNKFAVRIGSGPPKATETQADGAASTYAKRGALCDALNIVIDHDDDARAEGGPITLAQAEGLAARVTKAGVEDSAFLKFAGAAAFDQIPSTKFNILDEWLKKRETSPVEAPPKPQDGTAALRGKLWDLLKPVRGPHDSWTAARSWLVSKNIMPNGVKVSDMTGNDLLEAIEKAEIALNPEATK